MQSVARWVNGLGKRLSRARERAGFSQEEVALLLRQPRTVISNWESESRTPTERQLEQLASIYRVSLKHLLGIEDDIRPDFERLLFQEAGDRLSASAKFEVQRFLNFLDEYADFLESMGAHPGLLHSPFLHSPEFQTMDDARRKAEEVRAFFRVGEGPIGDIAALADLVGVTVVYGALGADPKQAVFGILVPHHRLGFAVLVNAQTTPMLRQLALAHELAHALFHGDRPYVDFYGRKEAGEHFADRFASEFLVPTNALRAAAEALDVSPVDNPEVVLQLQQLFRVPYEIILSRLKSAGLLNEEAVHRLRALRPSKMSNETADDWQHPPETWGITRFPRRFLRLLRSAIDNDKASVSGIAAMTGLSTDDVEAFLRTEPAQPSDVADFEYVTAAI